MSNALAFIGLITIALPILIVMGVLASMWRAWWLYPAWSWFLMPLGAPAISFWHFTALSILIGTVTHHSDTRKDDRAQDWTQIFVAFIWPMLLCVMLRWMK